MICIRCGLPTGSEAKRCSACERDDGTLASYEEVKVRLAATMIRTLGVDEKAAEASAKQALATLPDWNSSQTVSEDKVPSRLIIDVMAEDLEIRGMAGLSAPRIEKGERRCVLLPTSEGWCLQTGIEVRKGLAALIPDLDRKVVVEVPNNFSQVEFAIEAGNLAIAQVPAHLKGTLRTGNLEIRDITGIDVELGTGNIQIQGVLREGAHKVITHIGQVNLELMPESSVEITAKVHCGSLEIPGMEGPRAMLSRPVNTLVGDGEGQLEVEVGTGQLEIYTSSPAKMAR